MIDGALPVAQKSNRNRIISFCHNFKCTCEKMVWKLTEKSGRRRRRRRRRRGGGGGRGRGRNMRTSWIIQLVCQAYGNYFHK